MFSRVSLEHICLASVISCTVHCCYYLKWFGVRVCVRVLTVIRAALVCVDSVRNAASVVSGSVLLSLDVCGRAPETSSPSSVTLSLHCASVNTGSQVSSIPAGYPGSRGNGSSQSIGNRAKSHFASGWKLTVVQRERCGVLLRCDFAAQPSDSPAQVTGPKSSAASWGLRSCSGLVGRVSPCRARSLIVL